MKSLYEQWLGFLPARTGIKGNSIKLSWFNNSFQQLPNDATDDVIAHHARAHILTLVGSLLMSDTPGRRVHLMYLLLLADLNYVINHS